MSGLFMSTFGDSEAAPLRLVPRRHAMKAWTKLVVPVALHAVMGCKTEAAKEEIRSAEPEGQESPSAPGSEEEPPGKKILEMETLAEAIEFAKPHMTDEFDSMSPGALILGVWAHEKMQLDDVRVEKDETSYALVLKDAEEERGKRLCYGGYVVQVEVMRPGTGLKFAKGLLLTKLTDPLISRARES